MSFEEMSRTPYKAACPCGKGCLRRDEISYMDDWNRFESDYSPILIDCSYCKEHYHVEGVFLLPKGVTFPRFTYKLDEKYQYNDEERLVAHNTREIIQKMIDDMKTNRFMARLQTEEAQVFSRNWMISHRKKKSLKPMIAYLEAVLDKYDDIRMSYEAKKPHVDDYEQKQQTYLEEKLNVEKHAFDPCFEYDSETVELKKEQQKRYKEEHKYDDFNARVIYDNSFIKDKTGLYWDTLHVDQCVDDQYLILDKPEYGEATIKIVRKYLCSCTLCGEQYVFLSSEFRIDRDDNGAYYSVARCTKHQTSSFEAKTMEILNSLGINYRREVSFEGLNGDTGNPLRFDFGLLKGEADGEKFDLLIELQGPHHYKPGYYNDDLEFVEDNSMESISRYQKQTRYDSLKKDYCSSNHLALEYIRYTTGNDYWILEEKLKKTLEKYGFPYFISNDSE